jgi:hypothetical protein
VIPLVAVMFGGVVWLNAAKLDITKQQGQVARSTILVQQELSNLRSQQAQFDARVIKAAEQAGMTQPKSGEWTYLNAPQAR